MVSKKLVVGHTQSSSLEQRLAELQAEVDGAAGPAPSVIASRGFVPRTEETDRDKEEARTWDRAALLQVKEDDAQVKIYNDLARGPNVGGERPTRFGLGFGAADGPAAPPSGTVRTVGTMRFVSSGTPTAPPTVAPGASSAKPDSEWTGPHMTPDGHRYWYNARTQQSQWTPPAEGAEPSSGAPAAAAAAGAAAASAQPEWTGPHTTADGLHQYWYNTRTGKSEWAQPAHEPHHPVAHAPQPGWPLHAQQQPAPAAPGPPRKPGCTLLVRNIPPDLQDADVRELFGAHGAIVQMDLDRGSYSAGAAPKSGVIAFDGAIGAASAARALDGKQMRQYVLSVRLTDADGGATGGAAGGASAGGCSYPCSLPAAPPAPAACYAPQPAAYALPAGAMRSHQCAGAGAVSGSVRYQPY